MKKWLANKFMLLALWLNPQVSQDIKKLAIGYKIEREDIKKYQDSHPKCKSWLHAQDALIKEAVRQAKFSIALGLRKNNLIRIEKKRGVTHSEVIASLYIYAPEKSTE